MSDYKPPPHLRPIISSLLKRDAEEISRSGYDRLAADLKAYADRLMAPEADMLTRRRYLNRQYKRRSRARQKENRAA
jgi:hypothetical protein